MTPAHGQDRGALLEVMGGGAGTFSQRLREGKWAQGHTAECCALEPETWSSGPKFTAPLGEMTPEEE